MVKSKINPEHVIYDESKFIDLDDIDTDPFPIYSTTLNELKTLIVVGSANKSFISHNVVYFPVYMTTKQNKYIRVGVYEFEAHSIPFDTLDSSRLDLEKVSTHPLMYSFSTKDYVQANAKPQSTNISKDENRESDGNGDDDDHDESQSFRTDVFVHNKIRLPEKISSENKSDASEIRQNFKNSGEKGSHWVQTFMGNPNYGVVDNEGGGDCLFSAIRDAFSVLGQSTTPTKLRRLLSTKITDGVFNTYKERYDMYTKSIRETTEKSIELKNELGNLKKKYEEARTDAERDRIKESATKIKNTYRELENQNIVSKSLLSDVAFMKNISSLYEFKGMIMTPEYWADDWAISTLEVLLNIKMVILSGDMYKEKDYNSVLLCSNGFIDPILESRGEFKPDYYIILELSKKHYTLITYKDAHILTFPELPFDLKHMIIDRCMESNANVFSMIPQFMMEKKKVAPTQSPIINDGTTLDLYRDDIVFAYNGNSADKPAPGKGANELIPTTDILLFVQLQSIPNWRQMLSTDFPMSFNLDNAEWLSVKHYVLGAKYKSDDSDFAHMLSLNSNSAVSKDMAMLKSISEKGKLGTEQIRKKNTKIDPNFNEEDAVNKANYAKFSQNDKLKQVLLNTKNAKLVRYSRGKEPDPDVGLMEIRRKLAFEQV